MMPRETHTTVIVPGLRGHVEDHWQTRLAARLPNALVVPLGRDKRDLAGRVADLHQVITQAEYPVTLVAHSAGVLTTVHWARQHADVPISGALLATPPDLASSLPSQYPSLSELADSGWLPIPVQRLRFPSIVAASTNDALGDFERVRTLADAWGSHFIDIGSVGHLNPASGYGDWPGAEALLDVLSGMVAAPADHIA